MQQLGFGEMVGLLQSFEFGGGCFQARLRVRETAQGEEGFRFPQDRFADAVIFDLCEYLAGGGCGLKRGGRLALREAERGERQVGFAEPVGIHLLKEGNRFVEAGFGFVKVALRQIDLGVGVFDHDDCFHNKVIFQTPFYPI